MKGLAKGALIFLWLLPLGVKGKTQSHTQCIKSELKQRSCRLWKGHLNIVLTPEKISLHDSVRRGLFGFPLTDEKVEWKRVRLRVFSQRTFLEMEIWGPPQGEAKVQELHWIVFEILGHDKVEKLHQLVQRRRVILSGGEKKILQDPLKKHGLKEKGHGQVEWNLEKKKEMI